jgi:hypothetical protein
MRRILHLAWFDMLALRVPLAAWGTLLLVEGALFYFGPFDNTGLPEFGRFSVSFGFVMVRWVATVVIIALLVHADPTVGTTSFWRSRPISRPVLMASKLLSAFLMCVALPAVVAMVVLLLLGVDPWQAVVGGSATCYEQVLIVLIVVALASVTGDLVQLTVAAVIGLGVWLAMEQVLLPGAFSIWPTLEKTLAYGPRLPLPAVVVGLGALVTIHQYLTLRMWRSAAVLVFAIALASMAPRLGIATPRTSLSWPAVVAASLISPSDVALSVVAGSQFEQRPSRTINDKITSVRQLSFQLTTSGEPAAIWLKPVEITSSLEFPDHSIGRWSSRWPSVVLRLESPPPATVADQPYRGIRQALGNPELVISPYLRQARTGLSVFEIPESQWQQYQGQPVRLDATVTMLAHRFRAMAAAPLKAGVRMSLPDGGVVAVQSARRTLSGITVVLRETGAQSTRWVGLTATGRYFVLRNATKGLALLGSSSGYRSSAYSMPFGGSRAFSTSWELFFAVLGTPAGGQGMVDEWMKNAELVRVDMDTVGTVVRPLRIDNLVMGAGQK